MAKQLNVILDDDEHEALLKAKGEPSAASNESEPVGITPEVLAGVHHDTRNRDT